MIDVQYPLAANPVDTLRIGPVVAVDLRGRPIKPTLRQLQLVERYRQETTVKRSKARS